MPPTDADIALHPVGGFKTLIDACLAFHTGFFSLISRHAFHAGAAAWLAAFTPVEIITVERKEAAAAAMSARWFM